MDDNNTQNNGNKTAISILIGAILIAVALYFGLTQKGFPIGSSKTTNQVSLSPTSLPSPSPTVSAKLSTIPSPAPTAEIIWKKSDLITALSQKTGIPEGKINFSVGEEIKKEGKVLLRGGVSREGEMGGAGFFAVVDVNGVTVTYAGQGVPQCSEVNPYGYPLSWVDYCVDEQGHTVAR